MRNFMRLESSTQLVLTQPIGVEQSEAFAPRSGVAAAESEVDGMALRRSGDPAVPLMALHLTPERVTRMLGLIACALLVAHAGVVVAFYFDRPTVKGLVPLFDIEAELNIPTFFSTLILLIAASLTAVIHTLERRLNAAHAVMWAVLAGGFFFMAFDEAFSVHDKYWGRFSRSMFPEVEFGGFFAFAWVVVGIPLVAILGLLFLPFLRSLPSLLRRRFIIAGAVFLSGAIAIEMLSANWSATVGTVVGYKLIAGVEEAFEMAGIIIFIWAAMHHLADRYGSVVLDFRVDVSPVQ